MKTREPRLNRAHEELGAARVLQDAGFPAQAVSRAYYAAFYAAEGSLLTLGETRSKHSGVVAAFVQLVVGDGHCDERAGRLLRDLFERRGQADYSTDPVPAEEGERAVVDAGIVVALVETWLNRRS
ncbi:MAG: HEPN domain-containing protein [Acidimicrobiales bacterium]